MNEWLIALVIGAALGLVIGIKIARDSNEKEPVKGGAVAQLIHYLACAMLTSVPPYIITGLILGVGFIQLAGTGVVMLALTYAFLLLLATFERPAPSAA